MVTGKLELDPANLGITLAVLGMGGTLLTLFLLSLIADLLKRLFPVELPSESSSASATVPPPSPPAAPSEGQPS